MFWLGVAMAIAMGAALRWPAIHIGFASDDYMQEVIMDGAYPVERAPLDLFNFYDGSTEEVGALKDYGTLPWWAHPQLRLAMMRPLASASSWVDRALFGRNLVAHHLHSFAWWAFFVACVALLLRKLFPAGIAATGVLIFALEEAHTLPVMWLANRNAMISGSAAVLGIWAHLKWRREARRWALPASVLCYVIALLAGEWAVPFFGYLVAFELLANDEPWRRKLGALLPVTIPTLIFLVVRRSLDYGALHSGLYIDPLYEPLTYLEAAFKRIPIFFGDLVLGIPAMWWNSGSPWRATVLSWDIFSREVWNALPDWRFWHWCLGAGAAGIGALLIRWSLRNSGSRLRKELQWLLLGAFFSFLPMVASFASSRLVVAAAIATSAAWAVVLRRAVEGLRQAGPRDTWKTAVASITTLLLVGYLQLWAASARSRADLAAYAFVFESTRQWTLDTELDEERVSDQHVIILSAIEHASSIFFPFIRHTYGREMPESCRLLSAAPYAHDVYRVAENAISMSVLGGTMMEEDFEYLYRSLEHPFHVGDVFRLDGMTAEIEQLVGGLPKRVRFTFDHPLDDPRYVFLYSDQHGYRHVELPPVGEKLRLPRAQFPNLFRLEGDESTDERRRNHRRSTDPNERRRRDAEDFLERM